MKNVLIVIALQLIFIASSSSQIKLPKLENAEKKLIIDSITVKLNRSYIFADTAKKMTELINKNFQTGKYNSIEDPIMFSQKLTEDLISISKDKHLGVIFTPNLDKEEKDKNEEMCAIVTRRNKMSNYGFKNIKILPGNVGYLKFDFFSNDQEAFKIASNAMNFLSNTDAIIFDMRENGGGSPEMIQLISSYLFDGTPQHLNSFYFRKENLYTQTWTLPYVTGSKNPKAFVYILTSSFTFSGAEEFTYNLKNLKRATVVGETTGGGAHPVDFEAINDNFIIGVPFGRAINPITNSNWEGTGVEPDIKVSKEKAFDVAYSQALNKLLENEKNSSIIYQYQWAIDGLNVKNNPVTISEKSLKSFVGEYGQRTISFENGAIYYQRTGRPKYKMIPLKDNYFGLDGNDTFRILFLKNGDKVIALEGHYDDGRIDRNDKTK